MTPNEPRFDTTAEVSAPRLDRSLQQRRATVLLWIAMIVGVCLACLLATILLPILLTRTGHPSTENTLRQFGLAFKMYGNESAGNRWPALVANERIWAPDLSTLYPDYLTNPDLLVAREHPDAEHIRATLRAVLDGPNPDYDTASGLMALSFAYLGHAVKDEAGFQALVEARKQGLIDGSGENISLPGYTGMIYPLREGIERYFITDINGPSLPPGIVASIPVMVEIWPWKFRESTKPFTETTVLFMDGHVTRVPLGTFPVVPSVMDALCGIMP